MVQFVGRLEAAFAGQAQTQAWQVFRRRLEEHFGALLGSLLRLYGQRDDFSEQLELFYGWRLRCGWRDPSRSGSWIAGGRPSRSGSSRSK